MDRISSVVIVGAGAVGASIAAMLSDSGHADVRVCASGERQERYRKEGFVVNGTRYFFPLAEKDTSRKADLVILAVKNYSLDEAIDEMKPFVGNDTIILSLLNGITAVPRLREEFGADKVPFAMILGIDAHRHANEVQFSSKGQIFFGFEKERLSAGESKLRVLGDFLGVCNVPCRIPEDIVKEIWFKFMMNVAVNQWSALLRAPYSLFHRSRHARALLEQTMAEVVNLSEKFGTGLSEDDIAKMLSILDGLPSFGRTSMLQDVEAGRRTEVEAFAGTMVRLSKEAGIRCPCNELLYQAICAIEESYAS